MKTTPDQDHQRQLMHEASVKISLLQINGQLKQRGMILPVEPVRHFIWFYQHFHLKTSTCTIQNNSLIINTLTTVLSEHLQRHETSFKKVDLLDHKWSFFQQYAEYLSENIKNQRVNLSDAADLLRMETVLHVILLWKLLKGFPQYLAGGWNSLC